MSDYVAPPILIPVEFVLDLKKMAAFLGVGVEANTLGLEMLERVDKELSEKSFDSDYKMLAYLFFSKALTTFQAVRNLCLVGYGPDGLGLCASLFENLVDLTYMRQAPQSRARRYIRFEQVDKYYQVQKILTRKRLPSGARKRYRSHLKFLTPFVTKYLKMFRKQRDGWAGKSLRSRAAAVKLDLEYDQLYYVFCGLKHTLPMGAAGVVLDDEAGINVVRGPNTKGVYLASLTSTAYILRIARLFQDAYCLTTEGAKLDPLEKRFIESSKALCRDHPELCN